MLLQPVGGRGQQALLAAPVLVHGLPVTAAYLAAGGSPVHTRTTAGFFAGSSLEDFNPDAVPSAAPAGLVARVPFEFPADQRLAVAVGGDGVVFRADGCFGCFVRTVRALSQKPPPVALEALGALAWQRIVLGLADTLGALRLQGLPLSVLRCEDHG
ncbi:MAG: hypothetical protein H6Q89_3962 [Myxococcaceae bacterium]|nr:hypothetical protein [Myxococcaceae bacterium]